MKTIIKHVLLLLLLLLADTAFGQWCCIRRACIAKSQMQVDTTNQECNLSFGGTVDSASCNMMDGSIELFVSGARNNSPAANWSNGASGTLLSNLGAGSYTVTVTDSENCASTGTYTVFEEICSNSCNYTLDANFTGDCQEGTLGIDLIVSGASGTLTYLWSTGATTQNVDTLSVADSPYMVTVTDEDGCETMATFDVEESCECNPIQVHPDIKYSCSYENAGAIRLQVTGGTPPYTYSWSSNTILFDFNSTEKDISELRVNQSYNLMITDAKGCQFSDDIYVPFFPIFSLNDVEVIQRNITCFGGADGFVNLVIKDTINGPFTFEWFQFDEINSQYVDLGISTPYLSNLRSGIFRIIIKNKFGCQYVTDRVFANPRELNSNISVTDATCNNTGELLVNVSGGKPGYTYFWSSGQVTQSNVNLNQGWHYVTITDFNKCQIIDSAYIDGPITLECGDEELIVTGGVTPYSYNWNTGNPADTTATIPPGRNTATVTDATGCAQFITCGDCPIPIGTPCDDGDDCTQGDKIQNDCSCRGIAKNDTGQSCDDNNQATYNDRLDCDFFCNCECVGTPCNLSLSLMATPLCPDNRTNIQVELLGNFIAPLQYRWTGTDGFVSTEKNITIDALSGNYKLTVTDAVGCEAKENITFQYSCFVEEFCQLNLSSAGGKDGFSQTFVAQNDGIAAFLFNPYDLPDELTLKLNGNIVHQNCWSNNGWTYDHCPANASNGGRLPEEEYLTWIAGDLITIEVDPNCKTGLEECESGGFTKWELAINCVAYEGQFAVDVLVSCEDLDRHKPIKAFATGGQPPYTYEWLTGPSAGSKWTFDPRAPISYYATGNSFREFPGCDSSERTIRVTDANGLQLERTLSADEMPCRDDSNWDIWQNCNN